MSDKVNCQLKRLLEENQKKWFNVNEKEEKVGQVVSQHVVVSLLKNISKMTFEEEEQVGQGVSQDVVHSLLKNISIRTLFRNQERN